MDVDQRLPGRGAYLCRRTECATGVLDDGRRLAHALRTTRDLVTVDARALLHDWEAARRTRREPAAGQELNVSLRSTAGSQ